MTSQGLKKIEDALRESKEKYKITFDLAPVGISHTSLEGKFLFVNKTLCEIVGYTEDELLGLTFKDITHPDDLKKNLYAMQQMLEGKTRTYFTEKRYIHKNGSIIYSSISAAIVQDLSGNFKYFIAIIEDITRRKQLEGDLERGRLIESIGTLAGGIAHDFNNLLTALLLNIFLVKRNLNPDDESFKRLSEGENICMQSKELSNMLITFSRGGEPIKNLFSITEILKDTKNLLPGGLKNISCECIVPENLYPLKADKIQIKQVIKSIITNAIEAMPQGGTVRIRAENTDVDEKDNLPLSEGRYLKISIEDQGTGISEENLKKIFTPYFSTKDMYSRKGMGLALAICYSIIKRHNGLIT
ncbi:MAG: PAS domain S-box protein, partial [Nitrospinota bacterium]